MTEYYINRRTNEISTDDRYYGQPGWLVCTEEEYFEAKNAAELAALRAENAELREALESMLYLFDRELPDGSIGRIRCDEARVILEKFAK